MTPTIPSIGQQGEIEANGAECYNHIKPLTV